MPTRRLTPSRIGTTIALLAFAPDTAAASIGDAPVWQQVATAGTFKGYRGGELEFTFDKALFDRVVANFRRSPNYRVDANGVGNNDVIAWDFHHASEMHATEGTIPISGTPAQGWIQELAVRQGQDGKVALWALTRWLEPARSYVKEGRYKWASVSVVFDAVDAISGQVVGPLLTSVALTNQPFIEGMQSLAADRQAAGRKQVLNMYVERADSPEQAMEQLRRMLGLPETADVVAVLAELSKVSQWLAAGASPLGVDLEEIVAGIRCILNLPALASNEEVMMEVDKLMARLGEASGVDGGIAAPVPGATPAPAAPPAPPPPGAPALTKDTNMELKALADKLGVVAQEQAVLEALTGLCELRAIVASALGLENTTSIKVICKASITDTEVRAKYSTLFKALGVENPDAALDKVADLMTQSEELKKVAPELAVLKKKVEESEAEVAEEDVEAAMASLGISNDSANYEGIKLAVAHYRKGNSRDDFFKKYPKAEESRTYLTRSISTQTPAPAPKKGAPATRVEASRGDEVPKDSVDITAYSGANLMLKACEFVKLSVSGAQSWPWAKVHEHASALVRCKKVHMGGARA